MFEPNEFCTTQLEESLDNIATRIAATGNGPSKIHERFTFPEGFTWLNLDYDIKESTRERGTSYCGEIFDTVTGHVLWTGSFRRRRRDAERLTNEVLEILEGKLVA